MAGNIADEQGYTGKSRTVKNGIGEKSISKFIDYIKLEHTVFDIPFIVAGSFIAAGGFPGVRVIILVILAGTLARATGMSINRIMGKKYDVSNPRKKQWGMVTGRISGRSAIAFTLLTAGLFELCTFFLNTLVLELSPIVLGMFILDPLLKRVTPWRHLFMGFTIGVGVMAGFLAYSPAFPSNPEIYVLVAATSFWIGGFDMVYTIPDREFDLSNGMKTVMTKFGIHRGLILSDIFHIITLALFTWLILYIRSWFYVAALIIFYVLITYQHLIVKPDDPKSIKVSFLNSNSFIGFTFLISLILAQYIPALNL
jgi:putative 4-hydroxybenzoate polyprenyltransferase